jgi:hypothetical protein
MPLNLSLPTVGGSNNNWGTLLNAALTAAQQFVNGLETAINARLDRAGGTMTGRLDLKTATVARVLLGSVGGPVTLDCATAQYFAAALTGPTTFTFTNAQSGNTATAVVVRLTNGAGNATFPGVKWSRGIMPTLSSDTDLLGFLYDGQWHGIHLGTQMT